MVINVLSPIVANQIAAGEVVSRPSSIVKELMENSLDSGADNISLIIKDAGRTMVEVIDNGCGMDEEDSKKCFLAHATSKIHSCDDLHNLTTMGFRGEALASIAAISQVELRTKQDEQVLGNEIIIEGGKVKSESKATTAKGTSIKVKNIFFNTPARRNFLKSDAVENSHITEEFIRIALINNDKSFSYYNNDKLIFKLDKSSKKKRIVDLFGSSYNNKLLPIEEKVDIVDISGFISTIDLTRKTKNEQYFFVNNRFMKNTYLANAIDRAYNNLIPEKNFPIFFINLTVNPKNIDVNIHPTKTEIKFLDDKAIYSILYATARKVLGVNNLATQIDFEKKDIVFPTYSSNSDVPMPPKIDFNPNYNPFQSTQPNTNFDHKDISQVNVQTQISFSANTLQSPQEKTHIPTMQFINKYIITQIHNDIFFINQHKASKKIIYEKLISKQKIDIACQKLVLPYNHFFNPKDCFRLLENQGFLKSLGYEFNYKDDGSFDLLSVPNNQSIEKAIETMENIVTKDNINIDEQQEREKRALNIAENIAIKEGQHLNETEIMLIIAELLKLNDFNMLPNNEKVSLKIDESFLNKLLP
ncbi:MAG: DNA mismatch repair endonuclease MutL [Bacteroidales bacterium]|jgi:DNA mismatch repair protein MutL|nr:DNA mismatch repair endonuclease MutL [Bacteroidales bacterium]